MLTEPKKKILLECSKKKMRWIELKSALSVTDKTLNKHLNELVDSKFLEKSDEGYRTTLLGLQVLSSVSESPLRAAVNKRVDAELRRLGLVSHFMSKSKTHRLLLGFTAAFLGSKHAYIADEKVRERVERLRTSLAENICIDLSPEPTDKEDLASFSENIWRALKVLAESPEFRKKIVQDGKLRVAITFDLKKIKEDPKVLDSALFWSFR